MDISIITPTFNRQECIVKCLDSVTAQLSDPDCRIEHIVVDDGSSDRTASLLKSYAETHPHVRPIIFPQNRGVNAARNAAVREAKGEWCLLLDSDDALAPGAIKAIIGTVRRNPGYRSYMFTVDDRIEEMSVYGKSRVFTFDDFLLGNVTGDFSHLLDRRLMLSHPFDEELRIYEGLFFLQFFKEAGKMLFSNIVTHNLERDRNDSVSLTFVRYNDRIIERKLKAARLRLDLFADDYMKRGRKDIIDRLHFEIADNALLLGDYATARTYLNKCSASRKVSLLKAISASKTGWIYKRLLQTYLAMKHRRPQRGVN